jgi:long-chain fatty acid transport protein
VKKTIPILALAAFALLPVREAAAGGFLIYEHSALATGMCDARTALWDDPSSLYYNPAAITELRGYHISLGDTLIFPDASYTPLPEGDREEGDGENPTDADFRLYYPVHVYFTAEVTRWLTLGVSLNNPFGLGSFWPEDWDGRFTAWQSDLQTFFVQPAAAVNIARLAGASPDLALSLAVGLDYVYGQAMIRQKVDLRTFGNYAGVEDAHADMKMEGDAHGFGANFAFFAAYKPWISVGASVRSNVHLGFSGTAAFSGIDPAVKELLENPPFDVVLPEKTGGSTHIELPWNMNFGVAFHGLEKFTFAVDFYTALWECYDELKVKFDCAETGECYAALNEDAVYPKNWHMQYQVSVGAEYRPVSARWGELAVRLGYGYVTDPTDPEYYDAMLPDGNRHLATAGFGYRAPRFFKVDIGYMFAYWKDKKHNDVGEASTLGPNGKANGTYETMAHLLALTLGLNFGGPRKGKPMTLDQ